jgi:hypothetical protein
MALVFPSFAFATDTDAVKAFFDKNRIGNSADYGVFKKGTDHIITVHGFDKDLDVCLEIVAMLNLEQPDTYSCKPLNH